MLPGQLKDNMCILPWVHMHFSQNGNAYPCCQSDYLQPAGQITQSNFTALWNGDFMREMRRDLLSGKRPSACSRCYELEASGIESKRLTSLAQFGSHIHRITETAPDGSTDPRMALLDVRWSNLCNLKCRTCGPIASSAWYDDAKAMDRTDSAVELSKHMNINRHGSLYSQLLPHMATVERAYFAGGEPLLMPETYDILELWLAQGRTDIHMRFQTNFTGFTYKHKHIFSLWRQFGNVVVSASLDASGARGEYLRHGMLWSDIVANRRRMQAECPDVRFELGPTVSVLNLLTLPEFHRDWVEQDLVHVDNIDINPLTGPSFLCVQSLPTEFKRRASDAVDQHVRWLEARGARDHTIAQFTSLVAFMNAHDLSDQLPALRQHTKQLDALRGENVRLVFPELLDLFQ